MRLKLSSFRLAFVSSLLLLSFLAALAQGTATSTSLREDPVFHKNCAKCHGKDGDGRFMGGPSLLSDKTKSLSAEDLRSLIMNGKGRMPAFAGKLTPEALDTLVAEIKAAEKPQGAKEGQESSPHQGPPN